MARIIFERGRGNGRLRVPAKEMFGIALKAWCRTHNLPLETEVKFLTNRKFSFDWAIRHLKIAIEYEGGLFGAKGAKRCPVCKELPKASHFAIDRIKSDAEKYNLAAIEGWSVIRIIPTMLPKNDPETAIAFVRQAVEVRRRIGC